MAKVLPKLPTLNLTNEQIKKWVTPPQPDPSLFQTIKPSSTTDTILKYGIGSIAGLTGVSIYINHLQSEIEELERTKTNQKTTIEELEEKYKDLEQKCEKTGNLNRTIFDQKAKIEELNNTITSMENTITSMENKIKQEQLQYLNYIRTCDKTLEDLKSENSRLIRQNTELFETHREELKRQATEMEKQLEKLNLEYEQKITELKEQNATQVDTIKKEYEAKLQNQADAHQEELKRQATQMKAVEEHIQTLTSEHGQKIKQLTDKFNTERDTLKQKYDEQINGLNSQISALKMAHDENINEMTAQKTRELGEQKERYSELQNILDNLKVQHGSEINALKGTIKQLTDEGEMSRLRQEIDDCKRKLDTCEKSRQELGDRNIRLARAFEDFKMGKVPKKKSKK